MKIYLDTIGCRLNQAEIETYARQFRAAGHELVAKPQEADLAVVNTCAVTAAAVSDSRAKIRQAARAGAEKVIATGCWASLNPQETAGLQGVSRVVPNQIKDTLVPDLLKIAPESFDFEPLEREPIPGARLRTRAFIKVQDGCDNRCTFCVTTVARGPGRSRTIADIINDVRAVSGAGDNSAKEVVLTGVHLGSWGADFTPRLRLFDLVDALLEQTDIPRLRLSSLEPWDIDNEFFQLWENPRLCRQLHLPLQSGCHTTLRRMARKTTPLEFEKLVSAARAAIPDIAITTDIITGFPGESEEEFRQSLAFVQRMRFARAHVFTFSARPGTAAARMPGQVPSAIRKERNERMRAACGEAARAYQAGFVGRVLPVLWETTSGVGPGGWQMSGLTSNYLRVKSQTPRRLWNQITPVEILKSTDEGLYGRVQITA